MSARYPIDIPALVIGAVYLTIGVGLVLFAVVTAV